MNKAILFNVINKDILIGHPEKNSDLSYLYGHSLFWLDLIPFRA
jgi:hypothetical protein